MSFKLWLLELRIPFLTATIIPVLLGGAWVWYTTQALDAWLLALTLLGVAFLHLGTNGANEYFDYRSGTDKTNTHRSPFSGGSGLLVSGQMDPQAVYKVSLGLFALGSLIGAYLVWIVGWPILLLGAIGILSGYFYTAPGVNLAGRGLGEFLVGLNFGVLVVIGTVVVQTATFSLGAFLLSLPLAFLITAVLYINQFPDYDADKQAGKHHLVVRLGRKRAVGGYYVLMAATYLSLIGAVFLNVLPLVSLAALVTIPLAFKACRTLRVHHSSFPQLLPANGATIINHLLTGIILIVTLVAAGFL